MRPPGNFSITRGITKFPQKERDALSCIWQDISRYIPNITRGIDYTIFSSPIWWSIDLSAPSDAQRFVGKPLLPGDLLPSRWSRCTRAAVVLFPSTTSSSRKSIFNSRYNAIQTSATLPFNFSSRNFSSRKFVLASNEHLQLAVAAAVDSQGFDFLWKELILRRNNVFNGFVNAIHYNAVIRHKMKREKVIAEISLLDTLFLLVCSFRNFYMEIGCVQGCKAARLRRDKFPLFDINMAGISIGGYPRRDDMRGPFRWKMLMGWLLVFWILLSGCLEKLFQ